MAMWTAIVVIVAIVFTYDFYTSKLKYEKKTNAAQTEIQELRNRLEDTEYRLANLESLMLDREKEYRFHQALHGEKEKR